MRSILLALLLVLGIAGPAAAVDPDEMLKDPKLEARAEHIGRQLRCPVCRTESIEEFDAEFTHDLRRAVRERLLAGDTDQQVFDFLQARYGNFILLNPPFEPTTWALWLGPPVILLVGGAIAFTVIRRRRAGEPAPLSDAERRAVEALR